MNTLSSINSIAYGKGEIFDLSGYAAGLKVTNSGSDVTNYTINFTLNYKAQMVNTNFTSIKFFDASGVNYSFWIETFTTGVSADVWLKIPTLRNGKNIIYCDYNATNLSSSNNIFLYYESFLNSAYSSNWTRYALPSNQTPTPSASGLILRGLSSGNVAGRMAIVLTNPINENSVYSIVKFSNLGQAVFNFGFGYPNTNLYTTGTPPSLGVQIDNTYSSQANNTYRVFNAQTYVRNISYNTGINTTIIQNFGASSYDAVADLTSNGIVYRSSYTQNVPNNNNNNRFAFVLLGMSNNFPTVTIQEIRLLKYSSNSITIRTYY